MDDRNDYGLRTIVRENLVIGINDIALNSIVNEALESIPIIKRSIPFGIDDDELYIKEELLKVVNNIIRNIKRDVPFDMDDVEYINMVRSVEINSRTFTSSDITYVPFGVVDEKAYLEKLRGNQSYVNMPFGTEEMVENIVEAMANSPESFISEENEINSINK